MTVDPEAAPEPDQGVNQEPSTPSENPPREGAVVQRLLSGKTGTPATVIPVQVYDMINEIVNFTYEIEGRGPQQP